MRSERSTEELKYLVPSTF